MDVAPASFRFDSATLGNDGSSLFAAVIFLLRRRADPATARMALPFAATHTSVPAFQLRCQVAHRISHVAELATLLWETAAPLVGPVGPDCMEGGPAPSDLTSYLEALHRDGRWADGFQILGLADILQMQLVFFAPDQHSQASGSSAWTHLWTVHPHDQHLEPLRVQRPPLCLGLASGRVWALEPPWSSLACQVRGSLDEPGLLRLYRALPTCSSPSPSALSLLVEDAALPSDSGSSRSSPARTLSPDGVPAGLQLDAALLARAYEHDMDYPGGDRFEEEDERLRQEEADLARHSAMRTWAANYCTLARTCGTVLGRLP